VKGDLNEVFIILLFYIFIDRNRFYSFYKTKQTFKWGVIGVFTKPK